MDILFIQLQKKIKIIYLKFKSWSLTWHCLAIKFDLRKKVIKISIKKGPHCGTKCVYLDCVDFGNFRCKADQTLASAKYLDVIRDFSIVDGNFQLSFASLACID